MTTTATKISKVTGTPGAITAFVPGQLSIGQVVEVEGTQYKVSEINLARPNCPVLVPAA